MSSALASMTFSLVKSIMGALFALFLLVKGTSIAKVNGENSAHDIRVRCARFCPTGWFFGCHHTKETDRNANISCRADS